MSSSMRRMPKVILCSRFEDLVFYRLDVKDPKLSIVHPLTINNLNFALNDVDISILHLLDKPNGFGEKQVVVISNSSW